MKTFYNNKNIPLILPLLINNRLKSNFKKEANQFIVFVSKVSPVNKDSTLPMPVNLNSTTSLNQINFNDEDLFKIIQDLDIIKGQDHDNLSVKVRICDSTYLQ